MTKKTSRDHKPSKKVVEPKGRSKGKAELSESELEQVAGGASFDAFLKIDGIKGESVDHKLVAGTPSLGIVSPRDSYKFIK